MKTKYYINLGLLCKTGRVSLMAIAERLEHIAELMQEQADAEYADAERAEMRNRLYEARVRGEE